MRIEYLTNLIKYQFSKVYKFTTKTFVMVNQQNFIQMSGQKEKEKESE